VRTESHRNRGPARLSPDPGRRLRPLFLAAWLPLTVAAWLGAGLSAGTTAPRAAAAEADRVVIDKHAHRLTLWRDGAAFKTYQVALGRGGLAPKTRQGDDLVPEGLYRIDARNAQSAYHLALHISYPNAADLARAAHPAGGATRRQRLAGCSMLSRSCRDSSG
jgi:hypothetical protein